MFDKVLRRKKYVRLLRHPIDASDKLEQRHLLSITKFHVCFNCCWLLYKWK